jgi:hypothetical protein
MDMKFVLSICFSFFHLFLYAQTIHNVVDWGADPNGNSDAVPAIQKAIDAADPKQKTIIYFPKGKYLIASYFKTINSLENYCIKLHSNLEIRGEGGKSILFLADHLFEGSDSTQNAHLFYGRQVQEVGFKQFSMNLNGAKNAPGVGVKKNHAAIFVTHGKKVYLQNLQILNSAGTNMVNIKGNGNFLQIDNCVFKNEMKVQQNNCHQYDFSFVYSEWDSTYINRCEIMLEKDTAYICEKQRPYNGGIEIHGSDSRVSDCIVSNCFPGMYIASTGKKMKNVVVMNNKFIGCTKGISFWLEHPMDSITINKNTITIQSEKQEHFRYCTGIEVPNGNASDHNKILANASPIHHLTITHNMIKALPNAENASGIILHSIHDSKMGHNTLLGMNRFGIALLGSQWGSSNSLIFQNNIWIDIDRKNMKEQIRPIYFFDKSMGDSALKCGFNKIKLFRNTVYLPKKKKGIAATLKSGFVLVDTPDKCKTKPNQCVEFINHISSESMK